MGVVVRAGRASLGSGFAGEVSKQFILNCRSEERSDEESAFHDGQETSGFLPGFKLTTNGQGLPCVLGDNCACSAVKSSFRDLRSVASFAI
jgi:hypothetical protein